jgi:ubiquitin carboxyl-terminal hydrolase 25
VESVDRLYGGNVRQSWSVFFFWNPYRGPSAHANRYNGGTGPGKTAPRLQEDLLQYDPRKEADRGYNILTQPPPHFDGSNKAITPKGSCRHVLFIKYSQSKLPESAEDLSVAGKHKVAAYCQNCRYHIDVLVDCSAVGPQSCLCPNDEYPLHHFVSVEDGPKPSRSRLPSPYPWLEFRCTASQCDLQLAIQYRPPRLTDQDIRLLTSSTLLKARAERVARLKPDGPVREKGPLDVLDILRTYLKDALDPESTKTRIPMQNATFMSVFGEDCQKLLEHLGFRVSGLLICLGQR